MTERSIYHRALAPASMTRPPTPRQTSCCSCVVSLPSPLASKSARFASRPSISTTTSSGPRLLMSDSTGSSWRGEPPVVQPTGFEIIRQSSLGLLRIILLFVETVSDRDSDCLDSNQRELLSCILATTWAACSAASDRKSTRLNSSHANISYAVFCLK